MFGKKKLDGKVIGATLVEGLPIPENSDIIVKLTPESLLFIVVKNRQEIEIDFSKLTLIDCRTEVEMKQIV